MKQPLLEMRIRQYKLPSGKLEGRPSNGFGKFPKIERVEEKHQGWDLYAPVGTQVYAISDGKIQYAEGKSYGLQIILEFSYGGQKLYAQYAHLSKQIAKNGMDVNAGDCIGLSGMSGNAFTKEKLNEHLHFEIRTIKDPPPYSGLDYRIDPGELFGYQLYTCHINEFYHYAFEEDVQGIILAGVSFSNNPYFTTIEYYNSTEAALKLGIISDKINCVLKFKDDGKFTLNAGNYQHAGITKPIARRRITSRIWKEILSYSTQLNQSSK